MSLAGDTWPVFQEFIKMEAAGDVSGMTFQVEISTSKRARRLCEESVNWNEGTRLLHGMYMPALTLGLERERAAQEKDRATRAPQRADGWFTKMFRMEGWKPRKAKKVVKPLRDEQEVAKVWSLAHGAMWP